MCLIDDGERCEVWSETHRTARKQHKCDSCTQPIAAGSRYLVHFSVFEGYPQHEKMCDWCDAQRAVFSAEHDGYTSPPSNLEQMIEGCIDEGDADSKRWQPMLDALRDRRLGAS